MNLSSSTIAVALVLALSPQFLAAASLGQPNGLNSSRCQHVKRAEKEVESIEKVLPNELKLEPEGLKAFFKSVGMKYDPSLEPKVETVGDVRRTIVESGSAEPNEKLKKLGQFVNSPGGSK